MKKNALRAITLFACIVLLNGLVPVTSSASLVGVEVGGCVNFGLPPGTCDFTNPGPNLFNTNSTTVVDPGIEFQVGSLIVDISDSQIIVSLGPTLPGVTLVPAAIFEFDGLTWFDVGGTIDDVTIVPGNTLPINDLVFTDNGITFSTPEIPGGLPSNTLSTTLNIQASHSPVPTPSAMLLMGTGLIGLIAMSRRKGRLAA